MREVLRDHRVSTWRSSCNGWSQEVVASVKYSGWVQRERDETAASSRRALLALPLLLGVAVAGCADLADAPVDEAERAVATIEQAITDGENDNGDHAVVALLTEGKIYCTGVVVGRFVVATAAHCVAPTPPDAILFGASVGARAARTIAVRKAAAHPEYDEDSLENDIGVVGLAQPSPVDPLPFRSAPLDDSFVGHPIRLVGFGATSADGSSLRKRSGATSVLELDAAAFRFKPMPSQTCIGDSGGPALAAVGNDREAVVGIASSGDADCQKYGRHTRIDHHVSFLENFAATYTPPAPRASVQSTGCTLTGGSPRAGSLKSSSWFSWPALAVGVFVRRRRR
jgi:secreted trypsin-like serine protease